MSIRKIIQVDEKVPTKLLVPLSLQHTFAMFGASVLVPIIYGIDTGIVLLMNGIGTLLFIFLTKGKAPAYLGSSFAFLAPAGIVISNMGYEYALGGFVFVGFIGIVISIIIYKFGTFWINIILPPAAMGSVVSLIGFELAKITISGGKIGGNIMTNTSTLNDKIVFAVTLSVAILGSVLFRKFFATIPILIAIVVGYVTSIYLNMVDFSNVINVSLFTIPKFELAKFNITAMVTMLPVIFVIVSEHISHQVVTSRIIGRDLIKDPGLHKSLFADNFSTMLSGLVGGVPTTTYGENIGVMAITGVYSVKVIKGAAIISIFMAFIGPFSALIQSIPGNVIGGVTFLLYGMIGTSGLRLLVEEKVNFNKPQNLILTSIIFIAGLSGLQVKLLGITFQGMNLAAIIGIIISLLFYIFDKFNIMNEKWN
ncbi:uracil permease [Streptobacillus moniliformis]|uniref:Uracil-xanthine permease n=2 Tax=Streptobacillus moniliformis TaxID=34105 RepID=D1AYS0_STRM9|nr:uracil permease [Streptobacillus moniliformis]ACZ01446.1 uracil-xanthine permease [Streptobacillus moniliformis DSM 12112]AVL43547.1 uracil permease [Streptobacillus moniliformis]SQA13393.1 Uracil transporter [Streptobacillus moniliformis]